MNQKIKNIIISVMSVVTLLAPVAVAPAMALAASASCNNIQTNLSSGFDKATGDTASTCGSGSDVQEGITGIATQVVNIFSIVIGIIAVLMIIFGGFKYITSGGDSGNVSGAKNTLIYAIVGLIIVALAQLIVRYVLNTAAGVSSTSS